MIEAINIKPYASGAMAAFFDLALGGLTLNGCKWMKSEKGSWAAMPSVKREGKDGESVWVNVVDLTPAMQRHITSMVKPQIEAALAGGAGAGVGAGGKPPRQAPLTTGGGPPAGRSRNERDAGNAFDQSRRASQDPAGADIPF